MRCVKGVCEDIKVKGEKNLSAEGKEMQPETKGNKVVI